MNTNKKYVVSDMMKHMLQLYTFEQGFKKDDEFLMKVCCLWSVPVKKYKYLIYLYLLILGTLIVSIWEDISTGNFFFHFFLIIVYSVVIEFLKNEAILICRYLRYIDTLPIGYVFNYNFEDDVYSVRPETFHDHKEQLDRYIFAGHINKNLRANLAKVPAPPNLELQRRLRNRIVIAFVVTSAVVITLATLLYLTYA
jgi:hypothetical protein